VNSSASLNENAEIARFAALPVRASKLSIGAQKLLFLSSLFMVDAVMATGAFIAAYLLRFELYIPLFYVNPSSQQVSYFLFSLVVLPLWLVLLWLYGLYDWDNLLGGMKEYASVFQSCLTGVVSIVLAEFVLQWIIARGWVALFGVLSFLMIGAGRFWMRRLAYTLRQSGYLTTNALIVGANQEGQALGEQFLSWPTSGLQLIGFVGEESDSEKPLPGNLRVLGALGELAEVITRYQVEDLIIASSAVNREDLLGIFTQYGLSSNVRLHLSSGLFEIITTGLGIKEIAYISLVNVNRVRLTGTDLMLKNLLDYSVAGLGLILLSPVLLLVALLIKLDSAGPVLYRRRVMGLNGSQFDAYKFRTMHVNGDELLKSSPELLDELATKHKIIGDPRITRVGQWLRKYSLDELPQLLNVLRGEMSLVGPRMISPPELKNYDQWAMNLLTVRPGITGLWQVSGRSDISYADRVRLDMFYIRNYSIWLDLHLIMRTFPVVFSGKGAY
jgi:exopolysaccharide biosynthesis polyprenyl glycosylphosphotransferase